MLNLHHLKYFKDAADQGSLTEASTINRVGVSAISQAIRQLEIVLDCALITHRRNSFQLTVEGRVLQLKSDQILSTLKNLNEEIRHSNLRGIGPLKIATSNTLAQFIVLPTLSELCNQYSKLVPKVKIGGTPVILNLVESSGAEVGIAIDDEAKTALTRQIIRRGSFKLFAHKNWHHSNWQNEKIWLTDTRPETRLFERQFMEKFKKSPRLSFTLDSWTLIASAVEKKMGLGLMPDFVQWTHPQLKVVKTGLQNYQYGIYAYFRKNEALTENASVFLERLKK